MNEALLQQAMDLHRAGEHDAAERLYRNVLRDSPRHYGALFRLGFLCGQNGRFEEAEHFMGEAARLDPAVADPHFLRGFALSRLQRSEEAVASLSRALAIKPDFPEALVNRAAALFRLRRYGDAADDYDRLLALAPDYPYARGNRLACRLYQCDWRSLEEDRVAIIAGLHEGAKIIAPFDGKAIGLSPEDELRCARIWCADQAPPAARQLASGEPYRHARIRVAYIAAQFGDDPVSTLLAGIVENHDHARFETIGVSLGGNIAPHFRSAFEHVLDCGQRKYTEIATLLREREVDIAVDLMGFTQGCRPGIFAQRPAPVQVNYLGFAGTMGALYMDYIVGDPTVVPEGSERHYSEKVVRLPGTFLNAGPLRVKGRVPARAEAGLPDAAFVFASFNNSYKFSPAMFDVWMRLLTAVEGSVLWLPESNAATMRNLAREAKGRGVSPERIVFAPFVPAPEDHLARLSLADLFLDTYPYNAHSTAVDALQAGLPLMTCIGESFASRVAASLLRAAGCPELIAQSFSEYEATALKLADDTTTLARIRKRLSDSRSSSPLFDAVQFTRGLEAAYTVMRARHERGLAPEGFNVGSSA